MTTHDQHTNSKACSVKDQDKPATLLNQELGSTTKREYTTWEQYGVEWKIKPPGIMSAVVSHKAVDCILDLADDIDQWKDDDERFNSAVMLIRGVTGALFCIAEAAGDPSMADKIITELLAEKLNARSPQEQKG